MSAFICSDLHFASIVNSIARIPDSDLSLIDQQEIANELKRENIRSVNYRYNEKTKFKPVVFPSDLPVYPLLNVIRLLDCVDYQSCERPDYKQSKAYILLLELQARAYAKLCENKLDNIKTWSI